MWASRLSGVRRPGRSSRRCPLPLSLRQIARSKLVKPIADRFTYLDDGGSVVSVITAMAAYGHTPGHFFYHLESDGQRLVLTADMANHAVWSIGRPDWEVRFDMDKPTAIETRKRVLSMLAADRVPLVAYHLPSPADGYVEANGEGFRHVPIADQLMLNG